MSEKIYLLPGRGGRIDGFIGTILLDFGYDVYGHNIDEKFQQFKFSKQIEIVQNDLKNIFANKQTIVVASSYGAYLFLHSILDMEKFKGKAILFSPMLGKSRLRANSPMVYPPRAKKILEYVRDNKFPKIDIEVHTGFADEICDPKLAEEVFGKGDSYSLSIIDKASHRLDKTYIENVLQKFFAILHPN